MNLFFKILKRKCCKVICPHRRAKNIVIIFPLDIKNKKILLIEEYVHYYKRSLWKFVSGGIDKKGIDILAHAHEELEEEIGMKSDNVYEYYFFEKIFKFRKIYCYIAENPIKMKNPVENPDHKHHNFIKETKWVNYEELQKLVDNREIIWNESVLVALQILRDLEYKN